MTYVSNNIEDVIFYLDLTKEVIPKKYIKKAIEFYIQEKNKSKNQGNYGLLLFQKEGNPIFITNKRDTEVILNAIDENWKTRPEKQSFFENGLFYIFSYIAETVREKSKFNRVIIITDTPSDLNEEYGEALFNLVSKICMFPTFVDIIRISEKGQRFFKDDVKLNMLASDTKGSIFYLNDKNEFLTVIKKLVKDKKLVSTFSDRPDKIEIKKEDYAFYSKLAKSLKITEPMEEVECMFCHKALCPTCQKIDDVPLKCPDCNTAFHNCCIINYTLTHNIGIPNIFRCPSPTCDVLLQVKAEKFIELSGEVAQDTSIDEYLSEESVMPIQWETPSNNQSSLKERVALNSENLSEGNKNHEKMKMETSETKEAIKQVRIGGFFGPVYKVKRVGDRIFYEKSEKAQADESSLVNIEQDRTKFWSPSGEKHPRVMICPTCGSQIRLNDFQKYCPTCGSEIRY